MIENYFIEVLNMYQVAFIAGCGLGLTLAMFRPMGRMFVDAFRI